MRWIKQPDLRVILILTAWLALLWLQLPRLVDGFRVEEDFRTFFWMNKFQDPALFPERSGGFTPISLFGYEFLLMEKSPGYGLLFFVASFWVSPILFSKLIPFVLLPVTLWYLFEFGRRVRSQTVGLVLALGFLFFNLASSSSISVVNGLQRSFALPFVIALLFHLHRRQYVAAGGVVMLSALIYAPIFVLGVAIWGLFMLDREAIFQFRLSSLTHRGLIHLVVACGLSVALLSPAVLPLLNRAFTVPEPAIAQETTQATSAESMTGQYIWNDPAYGPGGAVQLFVIFPVVGRGGLVDLGEDLINLLIFLSLGGLIGLVRGYRAFELPRVVWCLLGASILMYVLAWLSVLFTNSFLLYLPSRYTRAGLHLFLLFFVFLNGAAAIKEAPALLQNSRRMAGLVVGLELVVVALLVGYPAQQATVGGLNLKWLLALAGLLLGGLGIALIRQPRAGPVTLDLGRSKAGRLLTIVAGLLFVSGWAVYAPLLTKVSYLDPPPAERQLLQFLATLPKDAQIAGTPCALDNIPLLAGRQTFFSCERHTNKTEEVYDGFAAYYAADPQRVVDFCHKYKFDYLVIDLNSYSDEYLAQGQIYMEPFNRELVSFIAGRDDFFLPQLPDKVKLFQAGNYFVVACDALKP